MHIIAVEGIGEVQEGDDLAASLVEAAGEDLAEGDILVIAQKVVSKSEGRIVSAADRAAAITRESARVLRRTPGGMVIAETQHGFVCANAGVDASNVPGDNVALLPVDPDLSARRIRARIQHLTGLDVPIVITDTFGRAWRLGQTNVAIGVAGLDPFVDYRGETDSFGVELGATNICIADELAGAAEMVMGKATGICAAIVKGAPARRGRGSATAIVRSRSDDLFR